MRAPFVLHSICASLLFTFLIGCVGAAFASGPSEQVLHVFNGTPDGMNPASALIADSVGNLYGTASTGGHNSAGNPCCGTIFEMTPPATSGGSWIFNVLHTFNGGDGTFPSGLIFDKLGNLYGTASGVIFKLTPPATAGGAWTENVLASCPGAVGKPVFDAAGNLYTLRQGNFNGGGGVYQATPPAVSGGTWVCHTLHTFGSVANDGGEPFGDLVIRNGILYGTTLLGGANGNGGTIFQLARKSGAWTETILHSFDLTQTEGGHPFAGVVFDSAGNLFGATLEGGTVQGCSCGAVFELSPPSTPGNPWTETTLYAFSGTDGANAYAPLIRDGAGNLYGTTSAGGKTAKGVVFKLRAPAVSGGSWTEVILHTFTGLAHGDGALPMGALRFLNGAFYGTASNGGMLINTSRAGGVVFSVTP